MEFVHFSARECMPPGEGAAPRTGGSGKPGAERNISSCRCSFIDQERIRVAQIVNYVHERQGVPARQVVIEGHDALVLVNFRGGEGYELVRIHVGVREILVDVVLNNRIHEAGSGQVIKGNIVASGGVYQLSSVRVGAVSAAAVGAAKLSKIPSTFRIA